MGDSSSRNSVVAFVLLTYGFSWGIVIPTGLLTSSAPIQFGAVAVSAFGPLVAATVLVWRGDRNLRSWVGDMLTWAVPKRWYLAAVGVPLAGVVAQTAVYAVFFGEVEMSVLPRRTVMLLGTFPIALLATGGNEEIGWRGYMLPQLQQTYSALSASVLVGLVWLVWHVPSDVLLTALGSGTVWSPGRIAMRLAVIPLAVILTWLYNSSRGSVLVAMLFHAGWNSFGILAPVPLQVGGAATVDASTISTLQIVPAGFMALVAFVIVLRYDAATLSTRERHLGPSK